MNIISKVATRLRETSFYKRLLLSYIAGLIAILLIVSLVCVNLINTISIFSDQIAVNATAQFQVTVESLMSSIQKLPTELSINPTVTSLMNSLNVEFNAYQRYGIINLVTLLKSYRLVNSYIAGIFLYFPNQDYLVSDQGVYSLSLWKRIYLQNSDLDQILAGEDALCWEALDGTGKMSGKTLMCSKLPSDIDVAKSNLCVFLNPVLEGISGAQGTDELSSFYTVKSDGAVLFEGGALGVPDTSITHNLILRSIDQKEGIVTLQEDYIGYAIPSNTYSLYHVNYSSQSAFFSTLITSKRVVVFSCFFTLILGVVLSIVSARQKSRPILRIANLIEEDGEERMATLEKIEQSVIGLVQIKKKASRYTEQYSKLQLESLLLKLLHQEIANETMLNTMMEQNGISILGDSFLVATVSSVADPPLEAIYQHFCTVFRAYIPNTIDLYFFQGADELKIVVTGWMHTFTVFSIKDGFQRTIQCLETNRHVRLRVAISEIHPELFQLGLAYEETQKVNEYSNFIGTNLVLTYSELMVAQSGNENSLIFDMWLNKFANTLANHDFTSASNIQKNIFSELSKHEYSLQFVKCKVFSFIDRTINIIGELDIVYTTKLWDDLKLADRLLACTTLTELEEVYSDLFSRLTQIVLEADRKETKVERILEIIQSNYTESSFGVSSVADQLGSSVAYVSRVFKDEFGYNMLNFIQKLRIDLAKKLLIEDPYMTITQISLQCGFSNNITFTRVFKNYEGVSPGKYRSQSSASSKK